MLPVVVGDPLPSVREPQHFRLSEELAGEAQAGRRSLEEPARQADLRVTREVCQPEAAADEQVQIAERLVWTCSMICIRNRLTCR